MVNHEGTKVTKARPAHHSTNHSSFAAHSLPPEVEESYADQNYQPTRDAGEAPERGADTGKGGQCELMMRMLLGDGPQRFDVNDATRMTRGRWVSNGEFARAGITRPNSRASQNNRGTTVDGVLVLRPHALIVRHNLWIDCRGSGESVERSICFRENAISLKRQRDNQQETELL
jgi:hypothetical protein